MTHRFNRLLPRKTVLGTSLLAASFFVPAASLFTASAFAQVVNGTISGTVTDSTGAVIPNAPVTLTNQGSGSKYTGKSNGSGVFSFTGLPSGDFTISITAPGFQALSEKGIHLDPGDSRSLSNLQLKTGGSDQTVTVEAQEDVPLDTGEKADLITAEEIKHLSVEGRDVSELFKTLPGFAQSQNNTNVNNQGYDPTQTSVAGASNYYSVDGSIEGINIHLDGANITDPGNYGGGLINVNYDQVAEVKVQTSNYGADIANGPIVVSAVTKSGTDHFHGELYTYGRTSQLNASDALNGPTNQQKDPDHEVYPGFAIGGPVLIPGTNFNHNRKLTFFAGAEDLAQRSVYAYGSSGSAIVHALVPTAAMRGGDYSATSIQSFLGSALCPTPTAGTTQANSPCANTSLYPAIDVVPTFDKNGNPIVNGQLPAADIDPGMAYIFNTFPLPNNTPTAANPYNWQADDYVNNNLWQALGRVDLDINDKNHLFARYDTEHGLAGEPAAVYYNPNGINTPGGGLEHTNAQSMASNLTTIISPTMTNQVFANLVYLDQNFTSANTSALTSYPYQGAYANGRHVLPQIQAYNSPSGSGGLPLAIIPDYSLGPVFAHKFDPEAGDNVTKVWGKHTAVFGVYGQRITNNEEETNQITNGAITNYYQPGAGSTQADLNGNLVTFSGNFSTNELEGYVGGYSQQNVLPSVNLYFWNTSFFATDSWKMAKNLTFNYGVRFDHQGLWNDQDGKGVAIFDASQITNPTQGSPYPGFLWHAIDKSIPMSGAHSYPFFVEPRLGFAWDTRGNGKTVVRGGWGEFRGHDSWNNISNNVEVTQNVQTVTEGISSLAAISQLNIPNPTAVNRTSYLTTGAMYASTPGDREQPLSDTYSLTLNQALPSHVNLVLSYVGANNRFLINGGSTQPVVLDNVNAIQIGGLYKPDPDTASPHYGMVLTNLNVNTLPSSPIYTSNASGASAQQIDEYRPLNTPNVQYQDIDVTNHNLFSNYNGVQVGASRQVGRVLFNVNYTFSKALGVRGAGADDSNGFPTTPFSLLDNYGTESFDRRHIFNATYTFEVGNPVHNKFVGEFTNGWEVSGITGLQSGADVTAINTPNLSLTGNIGASNLANGTANPNEIPVSNTEYLGTPDVDLQPTVTCNPRANLGTHQFANGGCFGLPNFLQNGQYVLPRLTEPKFFQTDLSAQKAFAIRGEQNITFRVAAFNFLNHPLPTLSSAFTNQYYLNFTNPNSTTFEQSSSNTSGGFGVLPFKTGRRIMEISAKYNF
jgi:hypothetical protein